MEAQNSLHKNGAERRCIEIGGANELVTSLLETESSQWPDNERKRGDYLKAT
jgi:hypothetical protein